MDLDLDRLQELAEGASNWCDEWVVSAAFQQRNAWDKHTSNYLAALDPRTFLALIERLRRAEDGLLKLRRCCEASAAPIQLDAAFDELLAMGTDEVGIPIKVLREVLAALARKEKP